MARFLISLTLYIWLFAFCFVLALGFISLLHGGTSWGGVFLGAAFFLPACAVSCAISESRSRTFGPDSWY